MPVGSWVVTSKSHTIFSKVKFFLVIKKAYHSYLFSCSRFTNFLLLLNSCFVLFSCKWECEPGDISSAPDRCEHSLGIAARSRLPGSLTLCSWCHSAPSHLFWRTSKYSHHIYIYNKKIICIFPMRVGWTVLSIACSLLIFHLKHITHPIRCHTICSPS